MQQKSLLPKYKQSLNVFNHAVYGLRIERCIVVTGLELYTPEQVVIKRLDLVKVEVAEALAPERVAEIVAAYPEGSGYGALILGEEINGTTAQVRLRMVVFDRTSREVVYQRVAYVEVEGTSPRELWSDGIYKFLKKWKF